MDAHPSPINDYGLLVQKGFNTLTCNPGQRNEIYPELTVDIYEQVKEMDRKKCPAYQKGRKQR